MKLKKEMVIRTQKIERHFSKHKHTYGVVIHGLWTVIPIIGYAALVYIFILIAIETEYLIVAVVPFILAGLSYGIVGSYKDFRKSLHERKRQKRMERMEKEYGIMMSYYAKSGE